jgi:hypothetical protein
MLPQASSAPDVPREVPPLAESGEMKKCKDCGLELPVTDFHLASKVKRCGLQTRQSKCPTCKVKEKRAQRRRYKVAGPRPSACECCNREGKLQLDHCHTTDLNRGWICTRCNSGIGQLGDNLISLRRALVYLQRFLDREGITEEETRPLFRNTPDGCCEKCGEQREESDFGVIYRTRRRVYRSCTCLFCKAAAAAQYRCLTKRVGPPAPSCAICCREGTTSLDHCHVTGRFRGWLCQTCNTGLGKLGDDISGVRRAIAYLERWLFGVNPPGVEQRDRSRSPRSATAVRSG